MGHDPKVTRLYSLRKPAPNVAAFGRAGEGHSGALALIFNDIPRMSHQGKVLAAHVCFWRRVQRVAATLQSLRKDGVFRMGYRGRIYFTEKQKAEIWDRWQRGESMSSIGRMFDRNSSSIYPLLSRTGGIRPPERKRSRLALRLSEREEISRGLRAQLSLRTIARQLRTCAIDDQPRGAGQWRPRRLSGCAIGSGGLGSRTRPKPCKFACRPALCRTVSVKLELKWSPQQIAGWLKRNIPDDERRVSHETIYRSCSSRRAAC